MVSIFNKMVLVRSQPTVGDGHFWGLVQQKGPWKETKQDQINASTSSKSLMVSGGGIGEGGTLHAGIFVSQKLVLTLSIGHGDWYSVTNPAKNSSPMPLSKPSMYASRPIVIPAEITSFRKKPIPGIVSASYLPVGVLQEPLSRVEKETQSMTEQERPAVIEEQLQEDVVMEPITPPRAISPPPQPTKRKGSLSGPAGKKGRKDNFPGLPGPQMAGTKRKGSLSGPAGKKGRKDTSMIGTKRKGSFTTSNVKASRTDNFPGLPGPQMAGTKRKGPTIPRLGKKSRSEKRPELRITTVNLPPSRQSSTRLSGIKSEKKSAPKTTDTLPDPRTRRRTGTRRDSGVF